MAIAPSRVSRHGRRRPRRRLGRLLAASAASAASTLVVVVTPGSTPPLSGTYTFRNGHSGLVLDTSGGGTGQGTLAVQAIASGSSTQKWTLVSEGSKFYEIKNSASGLLLGISGEGVGDGADALIWGDNGSSDHLWQVISAGLLARYLPITDSDTPSM